MGKRHGREYRWLCVCLQNMQGLGLNNRGYASPRPLEVTGFDGERGVNRDVQLYANGVFD